MTSPSLSYRPLACLLLLVLVMLISACGGGGDGGSSSSASVEPSITGTDTANTAPSLPGFNRQVAPNSDQTGRVPDAGSFTVTWTAPVARADGTPLSLADIDGYHIHYGESSGHYPNSIDVADGAAVTWTVNGIPVGNYYVVMTTYDVDGRESVHSDEILKTVQ